MSNEDRLYWWVYCLCSHGTPCVTSVDWISAFFHKQNPNVNPGRRTQANLGWPVDYSTGFNEICTTLWLLWSATCWRFLADRRVNERNLPQLGNARYMAFLHILWASSILSVSVFPVVLTNHEITNICSLLVDCIWKPLDFLPWQTKNPHLSSKVMMA